MRVFEKANCLYERGEEFALVTLVKIRGSAPQEEGAKALITKDGLYFGTVGGGKVEARVIEYAKDLLNRETKNNIQLSFITYNLQKDIGMTCGGEVDFLFEAYRPLSWEIAVFGAGHVGQSLIPILLTLNCRVICLDPRQEWLSKLSDDQKLKKMFIQKPEELVKSFSDKTYFVVLTQGHSTDIPVLEEIYKNFPKASYVGVIGSNLKAGKLKNELQARGVSEEFVEKLRCPIGLNLGANEPQEIAISIAAELIKVHR